MSDTAPRNPVSAPQMLADALLRSVAGTTALLRVTGTNTDTSQSEVGLVATTFADVVVSPVVMRKLRPSWSLGWIQDFTRKSASKTAPVMTGIPASTLEQVREALAAEVSFQFLSWTKLSMALATGSQHMNLLASATGLTLAADGPQATPAVTPQSGSTSSLILLAAADAAKFSPGSLVAVDADYTGQTGYVGSPVAGAFLRQAVTDVDYIRRITFDVGLVTAVNPTGIALAEPLIGGAPMAGAKVQAITGFVDREGGSFYQEWSALFVMEGSQGERIFFHYPRLQTMNGAEEAAVPLAGKQKTGHARIQLNGAVHGAAGHGPAGWGARGVLPQLSARSQRTDLGKEQVSEPK
jgi:hypothetical protein